MIERTKFGIWTAEQLEIWIGSLYVSMPLDTERIPLCMYSTVISGLNPEGDLTRPPKKRGPSGRSASELETPAMKVGSSLRLTSPPPFP